MFTVSNEATGTVLSESASLAALCTAYKIPLAHVKKALKEVNAYSFEHGGKDLVVRKHAR